MPVTARYRGTNSVHIGICLERDDIISRALFRPQTAFRAALVRMPPEKRVKADRVGMDRNRPQLRAPGNRSLVDGPGKIKTEMIPGSSP